MNTVKERLHALLSKMIDKDSAAELVEVLAEFVKQPVEGHPAETARLWTTAETAEYLGISKRTVQRLRCDGELKPVRIGKAVRFDRGTIQAYARHAAERRR